MHVFFIKPFIVALLILLNTTYINACSSNDQRAVLFQLVNLLNSGSMEISNIIVLYGTEKTSVDYPFLIEVNGGKYGSLFVSNSHQIVYIQFYLVSQNTQYKKISVINSSTISSISFGNNKLRGDGSLLLKENGLMFCIESKTIDSKMSISVSVSISNITCNPEPVI